MTEPTTQEIWKALGDCWTLEFGELELSVHHTLTEPTCPTAVIKTESDEGPSWRADQSTIDEAIRFVSAEAYAAIIERQPKPDTQPVPYSDQDQRVAKFLAAIDARKAHAEE